MVVYDVPHIKQEMTMACWHASARMIWGYKFKQSINPLRILYTENYGLWPSTFMRLAKAVGLVPLSETSVSFSTEALSDLLVKHGPLWVAGDWPGFGHVVVVSGIDSDGKMHVNDPLNIGKTVVDATEFCDRIASQYRAAVMYLPDDRANFAGFKTYFKKPNFLLRL